MATPTPPNVLLVMSDQHHKRFMSCAGDPLAHTPAMDALAARGVRFENAYCNFPLCGPSRMSFMTGRLPHRTDCLTNACQLRSDMPTFAHAFGSAGYETVIAGRMHFVGSDQMHGFDRRLISDCAPTVHINPVTGWKLDQVLGPLVDTPGMARAAIEKSGPGRTGYHAFDEAVAETTAQWLTQRGEAVRGDTSAERPFMMVAGFVSPHSPFVAPPEDYRRYDGQITETDLPDPRLDTIHPVHHEHRERFGIAEELPAESQRRTRAAYYGLCTFTDRMVGQILAALESSGLAENTIVVYTSDHGEQMGEHGQWWKSTFYDASLGVPLIVAGPGIGAAGDVISPNVSLLDLGPTLLDLAGAQPLPGADGRSFRCLLEGRADDWPDEVIAENVGFSHRARIQRSIRRGPWKFNYYHGMRPQLFHLEDDPQEHHDRWEDPACRGVRDELEAAILRDWDPEDITARMATRHAEQVLVGQWVNRNDPPEPGPVWFDQPPANWIEGGREKG